VSKDGICGHSTPVKPGCYVIFAASGYARSYVHQFLQQNGIAYKDLDGCYEDAEEDAYIVHADDYKALRPILWYERAVLWLSEKNDQFSMDRHAWTVYRDGTPTEYMGLFTRVSKDRALREGSWTYDPIEGAHYVCDKARVKYAPGFPGTVKYAPSFPGTYIQPYIDPSDDFDWGADVGREIVA
jgi:hypothetical protein